MKKLATYLYLLLSISISLTAASWFTWAKSCSEIHRLAREGDSYSGMCAGDGIQFVGIFIIMLAVTIIFLTISKYILRFLGFELQKHKK